MLTLPTPIVTIRDTFEPINCEYLDSDNQKWTQNYVDQARAKLEAEKASESPDLLYIRFLEREMVAHQELLDRFAAS